MFNFFQIVETMKKEFVEIVFPLPINQAFTYHLPDELRGAAHVGCRVIAPFGPRSLTGFILDFKESTDITNLKDVQDVLDPWPLFSNEILQLSKWISEYYLCSLGEALRAAIPSIFLKASKKFVQASTDQVEAEAKNLEGSAPRQAQILRYLAKSGKMSVNELKKKIGAKNLLSSINQLENKGLVQVEQLMARSKARPKLVKFIRLIEKQNKDGLEEKIAALKKVAPKQAQCLVLLQERGACMSQAEVMSHTGVTLSSLKSLVKNNLVELFEKEVVRDYYQAIHVDPPTPVVLNQEQSQALEQIETAIDEEKFGTFLLYGVTGSGKTQVYIEAINRVLQKDKEAIVLVPEIALTPQTVQRFRAHFQEKVSVLHSAMSQGERFDSWRRLKDGEAKVAVGPRSAVFAPLKNVGLIVVDEEQESSYKQTDSAPRYHARDVAIMRAKLSSAVVVLGSATPSAESYFNAQTGKYHLLELSRRIDDVPLPKVNILDLAVERRMTGKKEDPIFSRQLAQKIDEKLKKNEQVILLLNRRGFSSFIKCKDCGYIENCDNCNITLTYHLRGHLLRCHYCNYSKKAPIICPECHGADILFRGLGTQRVEEALNKQWPQARIVRMDSDTTSQKWSHDRILQDFGRGKYDILLGTQMIAKGLDFHKVTLVGVINADVGLLIPDFRSPEKTFQLLTQVAGRAGRKHLAGEVVIQTYSPRSHCLVCAQNHDFKRFFYGEISERKELFYPPYGRLISVLFRGSDEKKVMMAARNYAEVLKSIQGPFEVLGPTPSPIAKIQKKYRWQIILKGSKNKDPGGKNMREAVRKAEALYKTENKVATVQIAVDVDPIMLI
jgi:primosomal protein N' (replication factor Y)